MNTKEMDYWQLHFESLKQVIGAPIMYTRIRMPLFRWYM